MRVKGSRPGITYLIWVADLAQRHWLAFLCEIILPAWYGCLSYLLAAFVIQVQIEYNLTCVYVWGCTCI